MPSPFIDSRGVCHLQLKPPTLDERNSAHTVGFGAPAQVGGRDFGVGDVPENSPRPSSEQALRPIPRAVGHPRTPPTMILEFKTRHLAFFGLSSDRPPEVHADPPFPQVRGAHLTASRAQEQCFPDSVSLDLQAQAASDSLFPTSAHSPRCLLFGVLCVLSHTHPYFSPPLKPQLVFVCLAPEKEGLSSAARGAPLAPTQRPL